PKFMPEKGLSISGEVTRQNSKVFEKPVNLTYMIWLDNESSLFGMGQAAIDGTFSITDLEYTGTARVLVQAVAGKLNRNTKIFINKSIAPKLQVVAIPFNPITFDENELADYLKRTKEALEIEKILKDRKE